jgi:hypothetical protein
VDVVLSSSSEEDVVLSSSSEEVTVVPSSSSEDTAQEYKITVYGNGDGGAVNVGGHAVAGTTVTFGINIAQGYELASLNIYANNAASGSTGGVINWQQNTSGGYFFTMPASDVTVSVTFKEIVPAQEYKITVNAGNGDGGAVNVGGNAVAGTTVTFHINFAQGYELASLNIYANNAASGSTGGAINWQQNTSGGYFFTMPESDVTISVTFRQTTSGGDNPGGGLEYKINVSAGNGGSITTYPQGNASVGTTIIFNASPDQGYTLSSSTLRVMAGGTSIDYQPGTNGYYFTMPASDVTISASFQQTTSGGGDDAQEYKITVYAYPEEGGQIIVNPKENAKAGTTVTFITSPNQGYESSGLRVFMVGTSSNSVTYQANTGSSGGYSFIMPESDVNITATFQPITSGDPGNSGNPGGSDKD